MEYEDYPQHDVDDPHRGQKHGRDKELRRHGCEVCGKRFKKGNQLTQHLVIHKPDEEKPFRCDICQRAFNRLYHLKVHMVIHTKESPYTCVICGVVYAQPVDLRRHLLTHVERKYICDKCGKSFLQQRKLEKHIILHHSDKFAYHCSFCSMVLHKPEALNKHLLIHTGDRTHGCPYCEKAFVRESSLKMHMRTHRNVIHTCNICFKTFRQRGRYENHMPTHAENCSYGCIICTKTFATISSYNRHMKIHKRIEAPDSETIETESSSSDKRGTSEMTVPLEMTMDRNQAGLLTLDDSFVNFAENPAAVGFGDGKDTAPFFAVFAERDDKGNLTVIAPPGSIEEGYYVIEVPK